MPRRNGASTATTGAHDDTSMISNATTSSTHAHPTPKSSRQSGGGKPDDSVGIDDLLLPRTLTSRLARGVLPANTSIQKDATLALAKSATVFISYLAHHANEQTTKKTIRPQDVIQALREIEMAGVMELGVVGKDGRLGGRLEREMEVYENTMRGKRKGYRDKIKARESGGGAPDAEVEGTDDRGEPSSKRARRMNEEDEDEDERMLEQQLNGTGIEIRYSSVPKGRRNTSGTSPTASRKGNVAVDEEEDEESDADEEGEGEGEGGDEDEEEDEDEDEENDEDEQDDDDDEDDDIDNARHPNSTRSSRGKVGLMPDGNIEMGSEDESD
ncbi:uncharacterized protein Z518_01896 [Rhinocladiella mackenziei CBS 650.93]|uniref:DNA polymerase epsilon subunit D n=1 Tax=Rhinocladiella mackenziei CBS 650.93 TaxID=1442369 RepID=A0A0D2H9S6_9EURO|nr:uncharacterized protein Z518_01896 [Rhinocladiella mackenziei CBS 650.93]KIX07243.1 hypothetical protein Z518_01896 [Rhinocladiella mackenziei CBS 650.93]